MAHWRLGDRDTARQWYDKGVRSLQQHHPRNEEVHRFRAEAAELLGITANKDNQRERQPAVRPP